MLESNLTGAYAGQLSIRCWMAILGNLMPAAGARAPRPNGRQGSPARQRAGFVLVTPRRTDRACELPERLAHRRAR